MNYVLEITESIITCGLVSSIALPVLVYYYNKIEKKKLDCIRELHELNKIYLDASLEELRAFHQARQSSLRSRREDVIIEFDQALSQWLSFVSLPRTKTSENLETFARNVADHFNALSKQVRASRLFMPAKLAEIMDEIHLISLELRDFLIFEYKLTLDHLEFQNSMTPKTPDFSGLNDFELESLANENVAILNENVNKFFKIMDSKKTYADAAKKIRATINERLPEAKSKWELLARELLGADATDPSKPESKNSLT